MLESLNCLCINSFDKYQVWPVCVRWDPLLGRRVKVVRAWVVPGHWSYWVDRKTMKPWEIYLYVGLKVIRCSLNPLKTVPFCINHLRGRESCSRSVCHKESWCWQWWWESMVATGNADVNSCVKMVMVTMMTMVMTTRATMTTVTVMIVHPSWSVSITLTPSSMSLQWYWSFRKDYEEDGEGGEDGDLGEDEKNWFNVENLIISALVCSSLKLRSPHQKTQS